MTLILRRFGLLLAALAAAFAAPAAAQGELPPRPDGPIYDGADMLSSATEAALNDRLIEYNRETGHAIVIATIPSLNGETIEPYATRLFSTWGIGGEKRDTGLLLLISRDDRTMRIEVGYGLHPYFGGIMAGRVIRETITPAFKAGDFDGGVTQGIDAILDHLAKSPEDAIAIEEAAQAAEQQRSTEGGLPIGGLIWFGFIFFFFILPMLRGSGRRRRRYRRGPWGDTARDIILWEASKAIARGLDDRGGGWGGGGGFGGGGFGGGGGGFGGFGGGMSGGGGASGGW